jgi:predicted component of type VI protein secretion system
MVRVVLRWIDSPWAFELTPGLNKLGRNPTNDFRISDPSVSSFHAELTLDGEDIRVRDLGSTNGTFIDDSRVDEGMLKPQNILRLGNVRFQLEEVTVTERPHPASAAEAVAASVELAPRCVNHPDVAAEFKCENCGAALCADCLRIVGQGKFEATTICPICQGQCHPLPHPQATPASTPSLLNRLTRTLRIPFSR